MLTIKYFRSLNSYQTFKFYQISIHNYQSTNSVSTKDGTNKKEIQTEHPILDTKFNQHDIAYRYRQTSELLRGYFVYRLFSFNFLVNNQDIIAKWGRRILGERLFKKILKTTAFRHFVGGETPQDLVPVIKNLQMYNVKPILDYSVESDDDTSALTSSDHIDRMHEHNTMKFIECIKTSRDVCGPDNLIAIKVTALVKPNVLKKFNNMLKSVTNRSSLPSLFELINQEQSNEKTIRLLQQSVHSPSTKDQKEISSNETLVSDDLKEIQNLLIRLNKIAQACVENKISIMVDAEQTYFQTAINYLANELQRYYNKSNIPYIYGTYQCYLKDTFNSLKDDLNLAEKCNYIFAAKLVRGAYMDQERRLAREYGYEDPINPNFEATTQMYHQCLEEVLKNTIKSKSDQIRIMIASHNEDTIRYAIQKMKEYNIRRDSSIVSFASLYGMSDYVTFALSNSGYLTYKYLPYGPIESLQPYLFRRAQENRAIFEKADKDRRFHLRAFKDRLLNFKN